MNNINLTQDETILALGEELDSYLETFDDLDSEEANAVNGRSELDANLRRDHLFTRMRDICTGISALRAGTLESIAIQMRALALFARTDREEDKDAPEKMNRLIYSVASAIESQAGIKRSHWAGDLFIGLDDIYHGVDPSLLKR